MAHPALSSSYVVIVEEVFKEDRGVQADMGSLIREISGVDKRSRVYGLDYEKDTKAIQNTWIGCKSKDNFYPSYHFCALYIDKCKFK